MHQDRGEGLFGGREGGREIGRERRRGGGREGGCSFSLSLFLGGKEGGREGGMVPFLPLSLSLSPSCLSFFVSLCGTLALSQRGLGY